jgi:hypothetical protein
MRISEPSHDEAASSKRRLPEGFGAIGASGQPPIPASTTRDVRQGVAFAVMLQGSNLLVQEGRHTPSGTWNSSTH